MPPQEPSSDPTPSPDTPSPDTPSPETPSPDTLSPETLAVTAGRPRRVPDAPLNTALTLASTYHAGGPVDYGRYGNPTWAALEEAVGALEGGTALAFSSGMAAVAAVLDEVPRGAAVVVPSHAYLGVLAAVRDRAARGDLSVRPVAVEDTHAVASAAVGAAMVWLESPTNPALEVADLAAASAAARAAGALVVVDNTFATPVLQRPLALGADVVLHSATKYLSGHSDALLGAAVVADPALAARLLSRRSLGGAVPGALDAYLVLRGLRTLHLRVRRAQESAGELARRLTSHPAVSAIRYPGLPEDPGHERAALMMDGFGAIVCIEVGAGAAAAQQVCERTRLWVHATSLGGVESTLERRRRWAGESPDVPVDLVRLSVGIEDVDDLWADLDRALRDAAATPVGDAGSAGTADGGAAAATLSRSDARP